VQTVLRRRASPRGESNRPRDDSATARREAAPG
jgi:hypothetical protein